MPFPVDGYAPTSVTQRVTVLDLDQDSSPVFHFEARITLGPSAAGVTQELLEGVAATVTAYAETALGEGNYQTLVKHDWVATQSVLIQEP